jgi:hypothetical protein
MRAGRGGMHFIQRPISEDFLVHGTRRNKNKPRICALSRRFDQS